jgi:hypothetical protein
MVFHDLMGLYRPVWFDRDGWCSKLSALDSLLPFLNTYRTMCAAPESDFRRLLQEVATDGGPKEGHDKPCAPR